MMSQTHSIHIEKMINWVFRFRHPWRVCLPRSFNIHWPTIHYVIHLNVIIPWLFPNEKIITHIYMENIIFKFVEVVLQCRRLTCCHAVWKIPMIFWYFFVLWFAFVNEIISVHWIDTVHTEVIEALRVWLNWLEGVLICCRFVQISHCPN